MTGAIVLSNLIYLIAAVVVIIILSLAVTLRHRKPKSVEANMASFNRGLRALAPDAEVPRRSGVHRGRTPVGRDVATRPRTVQTVLPQGADGSTDGGGTGTRDDREAGTG